MAPSISDLHTSLNGQTQHEAAADGSIDTEFLIVGAGPAGAALACFLGSYGRVNISQMSLIKC